MRRAALFTQMAVLMTAVGAVFLSISYGGIIVVIIATSATLQAAVATKAKLARPQAVKYLAMTGVHAGFRPGSLIDMITQKNLVLSPKSVTQAHVSGIVKVWAHIVEHGSVRLCRASSTRSVKNAGSWSGSSGWIAKLSSALLRDPTSAAKYADYAYWIPFNVARIGALSLHTSISPADSPIFGRGPGYFLAAAAECGHQCATESTLQRMLLSGGGRTASTARRARHWRAIDMYPHSLIERICPNVAPPSRT